MASRVEPVKPTRRVALDGNSGSRGRGRRNNSRRPLFKRNRAATERDRPECTMSTPGGGAALPECTAEIAPATEQPRQMTSSR